MALSEAAVNDKIEVVLAIDGTWSSVQVRNATIISRDGVEISKAYHRHVVMPDEDVSAEDADVQAICNVAFTQDCKDAYATWKSANIL
mgnify:CR=1 FL=1|tara:strand:- start:269 stop:532 length:264 start_codon:yes stop_codon:yes gene_type:complete